MSDLITADLVRLDADLGADKHDVIRALAGVVADAGRATDADQLAEDALAREETAADRPARRHRDPALPHDRRRRSRRSPSPGSSPTVDFGAKDGPADLAFLIAAPAGGDATHLQLLTKLARALVKPDVHRRRCAPRRPPRRSSTLVARGRRRRAGRRPGRRRRAGTRRRGTATPAPAAAARRGRSLVAVTACPTGIAHTYMAAEALEAAAARAGVDHRTSRPRARPAPRPSHPTTIAAASAVIFAVDVGVRDRGRFAGKPVVSSGVKRRSTTATR